MIRRLGPVVLVALLVASVAGADVGVVPPDSAELAARVAELTAPEMEGRGSATVGGERAAQLIAQDLAAAGLRPVFQSFAIARTTRVTPASALELLDGGRRLDLGSDWQPHGGSLSGDVTGELVFAGYGLSMPGRGWDDYATADVRGRIAVVLDGAPAALADARPGRLDKLIAARGHGARALLVVTDPLPSPLATGARVALASASITPTAADLLLAGTTRTLADLTATARQRPTSLATTARVQLKIDLAAADRMASNVVAVLPGTDPRLAAEAVVVGAHYDHLGRVDGQVHPGADDNASGTAVVLGLARAFAAAAGAPRTLVFALFSGEELGLLGSAHYVRNPAWPLERTVAMVNFDMVGRLGGGRLTVGGVGSGRGLSTLVQDAGRGVALDLGLRETPFGPSDHARFYAAGVPVLFFHTGVHDDYHRPSDTAAKIDAAGMAKVAAVGARTVAALAAGSIPVFASLTPPSPSAASPGAGAGQAFLGVVGDSRGESDGVALGGVVPGGAAARAGLHDGDVLVRIGDVGVNSFGDLRQVIRAHRPGDTLAIVYLRNGDDHVTAATLDARP